MDNHTLHVSPIVFSSGFQIDELLDTKCVGSNIKKQLLARYTVSHFPFDSLLSQNLVLELSQLRFLLDIFQAITLSIEVSG